MIEKFADALKKGDFAALADCFSEHCRYDDSAAETSGNTGFHLYGKKGVEMFFHNRFMFRSFVATDVCMTDDKSVTFLGIYAGSYVQAKAVIEKTDADGLIEKMTVSAVAT